MNGSVEFHTYNGEKAVTFAFGRYKAMILPDVGGNLVSFTDIQRNLSFLRTPEANEMSAFKSRPFVYGIPVLFPPNRYEDGAFTWNERKYRFPVNELAKQNHLHGFLHNIPWAVEDSGVAESLTFVLLSQEVDETHPVYQYWPHHFKITLRYSMSDNGLKQEVQVKNLGPESMPLMLAFHTTLNVPFSKESSLHDYTYKATIGDRWELSERMLPTGGFQELSTGEQKLKNEGIDPFFEEMDNHYTSLPQNGMNYMALTDHRLGVRLIYNVGTKYSHWMIWNNYANGGFFCPEPQTSVVNAPNISLSNDESGLIVLNPGQVWTETSNFSLEHVSPAAV